MSEQLVFDMSGDEKGAVAAFKRLQKENEKLKQGFADLAKESAKAEKQTTTWSDKATAGMGNMVAGVFSLAAALKVASAEYQHLIDRQNKAAKTVITTSNARQGFQRNLGDVSQDERAWWDKTIMGIASRTKQLPANVYQAAGEASASQGNLTREQLARNVELGFRVAPESAQEAQALAGGLGDLASLTGSGDSMVNLGMMLAAGKQARVSNLRQVAQNLVPGAIGVQGFGGTDAEAMALATTLTNLSKDTTGAASKTAAIAFAEQADKILGAAGSPLEHIRAMQNDPSKAKKFMEKASLPMEYKIPIQQLITKGSAADQLFTSNLGGYGDQAGMAASAERYVNAVTADPMNRVATVDRSLESAEQQTQLRDTGAAMDSVIRSRVNNVLRATGDTWLGNQVSMRAYDFSRMWRSPEEAGAVTIAARYGHLARTAGDSPSEETRENLRLLKALYDELQGMRTDNKREAAKPKAKNVDRHGE